MSSLVYSDEWVSICNMALGRLGAGTIDSLAEGTPLARYCNLYLGNVVETILGAHDWRTLRKRLELAALTETPLYEYDYAYRLPADFIRIIEVDCEDQPFSFEDDTILTDAGEVNITYIYRPSDNLVAMPGYLKRAISSELSAQLAPELKESEQTNNRTLGEAARALTLAIKADARQNQYVTRADAIGTTYTEEVR